jgi:RNA polymerase sigma-70 factor (ECF subfamily)
VTGTRRGEDFDEFFRNVYPRACRAAERASGNHTVAEDAALEALTRAFVRWPRLRSLPYREAWVLRVAINEALGQIRIAARRSARTGFAGLRVSHDFEDGLTNRLALAAALRGLPRRQRQAVELRYLADLSERDTAAALGVSSGTLKSHLHRGAKALRLVLDTELVRELIDVRD